VTRYFDEKFKQIEALIGKLKLKNSTLRSAITKIERQLAQKEEIGKPSIPSFISIIIN
jgi:hypothetical protein